MTGEVETDRSAPTTAEPYSEKLAELRAKTDRQLAEYLRAKLDLAVSLAFQGEQERRSGYWASAEEYQRKWREVIAEVKRLMPLVRKSGVSLIASEKHAASRSRRKGR